MTRRSETERDPRRLTDALRLVLRRCFPVELRDVSFRYSSSQPLLFDRLSLRVAPGTKIGLVGRSGGGKTTLTRLLLRFADVEAGQILVGGQSIASVPQAALRKVIGYVPQDRSMFHRSIADNIRIGRSEATDAEVRHAAQLAHAAEFMRRCPRVIKRSSANAESSCQAVSVSGWRSPAQS